MKWQVKEEMISIFNGSFGGIILAVLVWSYMTVFGKNW